MSAGRLAWRTLLRQAQARRTLANETFAPLLNGWEKPMWFVGKPKNRAFERRHVLDVKVARRQAARMRVRVATLAASLSLGTLFGLYALWRGGEWGMNHFIYENNAFAIHELDVQTDGVISLEQLRRWAGVKRGQNLFALDLTRVKRDLELVPAIQSVAVERVLPHTLKVRIIEREPIAQMLQVQNYLIDAEGFAMLPLDPQQRSIPVQPGEHYPIITGLSAAELRAGRQVESPQVRAALKFLGAFEHSAMAPLVDIARIDVSAPDVLQVFTAQQNEIIFRTTDFDRQLNRWWLVYNKGQEQSHQIASLDLSVSENVPLRWLDTVAVPPTVTKMRKPSPYKKKHV
jgi:cell division protein FtsQ